MRVSETDCAYLAGLIDGDGSFWSQINRNGGRSVFLGIYSVDRRSLEYVLNTFGGVIYGSENGVKHNSKRKLWTWRIAGKELYALVDMIIPYLVIKKDRAICVQEIGAIRSLTKPKRDYVRIEELCQLIRSENYVPKTKLVS